MKAVKNALKALWPFRQENEVPEDLVRCLLSLRTAEQQYAYDQDYKQTFGKRPEYSRRSIERLEECIPGYVYKGDVKTKVVRESATYPDWTTPHGEFRNRPEKYGNVSHKLRQPRPRKRHVGRPAQKSESQSKSSQNYSWTKKANESKSRPSSHGQADARRCRRVRTDDAPTDASSESSGSSDRRVQDFRQRHQGVHAKGSAPHKRQNAPSQSAGIPQAPPQALAQAQQQQHAPNRYVEAPQAPAQAQQHYIPAQQQDAPQQYAFPPTDAGFGQPQRNLSQLSLRDQDNRTPRASAKSLMPSLSDPAAARSAQPAASQAVSDSSLGEPDVNPSYSSHADSDRYRSAASRARSNAQICTSTAASPESSLGAPNFEPSNASGRSSQHERSRPDSGHAIKSTASSASSLGEPNLEPSDHTSGRSSQRSKVTYSSSSSRLSTSTAVPDGENYFEEPTAAAPPLECNTFDHIRRKAPRAPSVDSQRNERGTQAYYDHKLEKRHRQWDENIGAIEGARGTRAPPSVWSETSRHTAGGGPREHDYGQGQRYRVAPRDAISHAGVLPFRERSWHKTARSNADATVYTQYGTATTPSVAPSNDPTERGSEWWERGGVEADPGAYAQSATASNRTYETGDDPSCWSGCSKQDEQERLAEKERIAKLKQRYREANAPDGQF
ncbi:hypothetical protein EJ03DRAFT_353028 [Teratosphaeria nubilosa]|uniref:Uncharacterized protein n=1 Tax=Teratosphaeria nubilosa TaxID=161662 RepID=A0A6G1L3N5_9PEZI|nr:hypothetical protein EJ03DRAFT_353028 [Teratosphaeria nubilosa]